MKKFLHPQSFKRGQSGINMVDLMMWLVIAALLLAAALQSIGYYQRVAYLYQMNTELDVVASKITATGAIEGTGVTQDIIARVVADENAARPGDHIVISAGTLSSYASGGALTSDYGFERAASVTTEIAGQSSYIKATHDLVTNKESAYFFKASASYKVGVNVVGFGTLDSPVVTDPTPGGGTTTPPAVPADFSKDPVWTQATTGLGTNVWYGVAISSDGKKMATAPSIDTQIGNNGGRIRTSTDSGVTWTEQAGSPYANWRGLSSSADGTTLVGGVYDGNIYISKDSGVTWTMVAGDGNTAPGIGRWYGVSVTSDGKNIFAVSASASGYPWVSNDYGATWRKVTNVNGTADSGKGTWFPVAQSNGGQKLATAKYRGYVYTSDDYGVTWKEQTSVGTGLWARFAASTDGSNLVATTLQDINTAGSGRLFISKNFGTSFIEQTSVGPGNWTGAAMSADGTKVLAGEVANANSSGRLMFSVDSGTTWKVQSTPTNGTYYNAAITPDGTKMLTGNSVAGQSLFTGIVK